MNKTKAALWLSAIALVAMLTMPVAAQAATIYVNSGVSGARLGMKATTAASKLGTVKKIYHDNEYGYKIVVRCFGTKNDHGEWSLLLYSNGAGRVTAFVMYASKYRTTKGIHTGSSVTALKKAYGKSLTRSGSTYKLKGTNGKTWFSTSGGKVHRIMVWR